MTGWKETMLKKSIKQDKTIKKNLEGLGYGF